MLPTLSPLTAFATRADDRVIGDRHRQDAVLPHSAQEAHGPLPLVAPLARADDCRVDDCVGFQPCISHPLMKDNITKKIKSAQGPNILKCFRCVLGFERFSIICVPNMIAPLQQTKNMNYANHALNGPQSFAQTLSYHVQNLGGLCLCGRLRRGVDRLIEVVTKLLKQEHQLVLMVQHGIHTKNEHSGRVGLTVN